MATDAEYREALKKMLQMIGEDVDEYPIAAVKSLGDLIAAWAKHFSEEIERIEVIYPGPKQN